MFLKRPWLLTKALAGKLLSAIKAVPSLLLKILKRLPEALVIVIAITAALLCRFLLALPRAIYGSLKGLALVLGCAYLALLLMTALSQLPTPGVPSIQVTKNLPQLLPNPVYDYNRSVVRLSVNGQFFCSGVVIGKNYILTASHCVVDESDGVMKNELITIDGDNGRVQVTGRPVGVNLRMDWGLIHGNFSSIPAAHVMSNDITKDKTLKACGFPQGNHQVYCATLEQDGSDLFLLKTKGLVWPGMSGGPVFDKDGNVVALNIRGYELSDKGGSGISPTLGILANFGIAD